jgi:ADP-heptose:LPS heptosyltransferase/lipopolysaccharide biosynthesis glycosyltransferase
MLDNPIERAKAAMEADKVIKPKKLAIMTIVSGDKYQKIWERSEPFFNAYADKIGADLLVLKDIPASLPSPHWAKFSIYELLHKQYDRVAFIDADIIIRPDAPSLFDIVPEDMFGIFNEGLHSPRSICIYETMKVYNIKLPKWNGRDYYNTGVMVVSREHRHIFKIEEEIKPLRNSFGEQTYLNMRILSSGVRIFALHHKFNRMSLMDMLTGVSRLASYFVHYAGDGTRLLDKMDRDIEKWADDPSYQYKQKIIVWALGGLGDCVCAEPSIRYMRKEVHPDADIYVITKPRNMPFYKHIEGITLVNEGDIIPGDIDAVTEFYTHHSPTDKFTDFQISFANFSPLSLCQAVDWVSMNTMNRMMPLKDREIKLTYTNEDLQGVLSIEPNLKDLILVHAGSGWETKTFPVKWWQEVVDTLSNQGIRVGLIGEKVSDEHGYVPITCPPKGVDFRDKITIPQLVALISQAPVLVTNDSAPTHIGGAFDNYIILVPTCKHGDLLMPYRNGQQYYKAVSMYKRSISQDSPVRATDVKGWQTSHLPQGHSIWEYIPEAGDVAQQAVTFFMQSKGLFCINKLKEVVNE